MKTKMPETLNDLSTAELRDLVGRCCPFVSRRELVRVRVNTLSLAWKAASDEASKASEQVNEAVARLFPGSGLKSHEAYQEAVRRMDRLERKADRLWVQLQAGFAALGGCND